MSRNARQLQVSKAEGPGIEAKRGQPIALRGLCLSGFDGRGTRRIGENHPEQDLTLKHDDSFAAGHHSIRAVGITVS